MKQLKSHLSFALLIAMISTISVNAQVEERTKSLVTKNDGTEYVGFILKQDAREILLQTDQLGEIIIPKHEIRTIEEIKDEKYVSAKYDASNIFATRYFFTHNGLPLNKGDSYAMIQLAGAEYHVAIADNFTIGGLTSWIGVPLVASAKYAIRVTDNFSLAVGALAGTGSWASWNTYGVMPYGSVTIGNPNLNLNFSGGYLTLNFANELSPASAPLFSIGGLARLNDRVSFVGDSFIFTQENLVALVVPGLRFDRKNGGAFQFGLAALVTNSEMFPVPLPFISWFTDI